MSGALVLLGILAGHPSQASTAIALAVFGLGFGVVGQVLTVAVQNEVDRRQLGVAMSTTTFFRGLGGAIGAAVLGAVFAARAGTSAGGVDALGATGRADLIDAVQTVLFVAAPIAALGLLVVLLLEERPLQTTRAQDRPAGQPPADSRPGRPPVATAAAREAS
jgi:MFS family permease